MAAWNLVANCIDSLYPPDYAYPIVALALVVVTDTVCPRAGNAYSRSRNRAHSFRRSDPCHRLSGDCFGISAERNGMNPHIFSREISYG